MAVTVIYLGPLRDLAGCDSVQFDAPLDWAGLIDAVPAPVAEQLRMGRVNVAHEGRVLGDKTALRAVDGEDVALLPPVSGG